MDVQSINCYYKVQQILVSIVVSIPACHAGDRGSIPRRGGNILLPHRTNSVGILPQRQHEVLTENL